jgi:hypothetical protein
MLKYSSFSRDFSAAASHRGFSPHPAQVSLGLKKTKMQSLKIFCQEIDVPLSCPVLGKDVPPTRIRIVAVRSRAQKIGPATCGAKVGETFIVAHCTDGICLTASALADQPALAQLSPNQCPHNGRKEEEIAMRSTKLIDTWLGKRRSPSRPKKKRGGITTALSPTPPRPRFHFANSLPHNAIDSSNSRVANKIGTPPAVGTPMNLKSMSIDKLTELRSQVDAAPQLQGNRGAPNNSKRTRQAFGSCDRWVARQRSSRRRAGARSPRNTVIRQIPRRATFFAYRAVGVYTLSAIRAFRLNHATRVGSAIGVGSGRGPGAHTCRKHTSCAG